MKLFNLFWKRGLMTILGFIILEGIKAQYTWDIHDPVDLNKVDFADNKLLLYNGVGVALALLISRNNDTKSSGSSAYSEVTFNAWKEYNRLADQNIQSIEIRRGFYLRRYLSVGAGFSTFRAGESFPGIGFNVFFRWHIINKKRFILSYDNGVGPNLFTKAYPEGGTRFNFATQYSLSFSIKSTKGTWVVFKISNIHISNADIKGRERNPALDALGCTLGISL